MAWWISILIVLGGLEVIGKLYAIKTLLQNIDLELAQQRHDKGKR